MPIFVDNCRQVFLIFVDNDIVAYKADVLWAQPRRHE